MGGGRQRQARSRLFTSSMRRPAVSSAGLVATSTEAPARVRCMPGNAFAPAKRPRSASHCSLKPGSHTFRRESHLHMALDSQNTGKARARSLQLLLKKRYVTSAKPHHSGNKHIRYANDDSVHTIGPDLLCSGRRRRPGCAAHGRHHQQQAAAALDQEPRIRWTIALRRRRLCWAGPLVQQTPAAQRCMRLQKSEVSVVTNDCLPGFVDEQAIACRAVTSKGVCICTCCRVGCVRAATCCQPCSAALLLTGLALPRLAVCHASSLLLGALPERCMLPAPPLMLAVPPERCAPPAAVPEPGLPARWWACCCGCCW